MSRLRDLETSARIKLALITNPHIGGLDIAVETVNGIVLLDGAVQDQEHKDLAEQIAREHGGIDIKNDIIVLSGVVEESPLLAIPAGEDGLSLQDRVFSALQQDNRVNPYTLNVEANGSVVRLTGVQEDPAARDQAEEIAHGVPGVELVVNEIEIRRAA